MEDVDTQKGQGPQVEVLLKCLDIEWQDHFQTRGQTWKTLQMTAALAVGLIGVDWRLQNATATALVAAVLMLTAAFGALITRHHRQVEIQKFKSIHAIEKLLNLQHYGLFNDTKVPEPYQLLDAVNFAKSNTSLFIFRTHISFLIFGLIYLVFRLLSSHA